MVGGRNYYGRVSMWRVLAEENWTCADRQDHSRRRPWHWQIDTGLDSAITTRRGGRASANAASSHRRSSSLTGRPVVKRRTCDLPRC